MREECSTRVYKGTKCNDSIFFLVRKNGSVVKNTLKNLKTKGGRKQLQHLSSSSFRKEKVKIWKKKILKISVHQRREETVLAGRG